MGASPWLVAFVALLKVWSLIRSGQLGSLALWGELQFAHRIGGWIQVGPCLHVGRVHGWSWVSWGPAQTAQQESFWQRAAGCP